jgi:hypothetical protein
MMRRQVEASCFLRRAAESTSRVVFFAVQQRAPRLGMLGDPHVGYLFSVVASHRPRLFSAPLLLIHVTR